ncbi:hypothetical protein GTW43_20670 [Streptomyces sp. SID5785]|nr:hypothetical protein [Streptomyces sp. SID5785]
MSAPPERLTLQIKPRLTDAEGRTDHGNPLRAVTVTATGRRGESGYPRYAGEGVQAEVDPRSGAVEAVTVDGRELPYGWVAEVLET